MKITDPEELVISREEFSDIEKKMEEILSEFEWKVLMAYLEENLIKRLLIHSAGMLNRLIMRCRELNGSSKDIWMLVLKKSILVQFTADFLR